MALANQLRQELGEALFDALCAGTTLAPLTTNHPDIDIEDAYHISRAMLACRIAQNSEQVVGKKIGAYLNKEQLFSQVEAAFGVKL